MPSLRWDCQQRALQDFTSSRLGEPFSPERDHPSPNGLVPRLSYNWSEMRPAPTISRLGEPLSPEWDSTSLKTKALRLSESSSKNHGEVLLFSPRLDMLAWAKISDLATIQTRINRLFIPNNICQAFHTTKAAYNSYGHEISWNRQNIVKSTWTLAALTWKRLAKDLDTQTVEHNNYRSIFVSCKIMAQIGNEVIKMNLYWNHENKTREEGIRVEDQLMWSINGVELGWRGMKPNPSRALLERKRVSERAIFWQSAEWREQMAVRGVLDTLWVSLRPNRLGQTLKHWGRKISGSYIYK